MDEDKKSLFIDVEKADISAEVNFIRVIANRLLIREQPDGIIG